MYSEDVDGLAYHFFEYGINERTQSIAKNNIK